MDMRPLAAALIRHARQVLPKAQAQWGAAMAQEAEHIEGERAALTWALGCVAASYGERLRAEHFLLPLLGRWYLACLCVTYAVGHFVEPPYAQLLCRLTGDPTPVYLPFPFSIPFTSALMPHVSAAASCYFMQPAPLWPSMLVLTKSALFLFAAVQLVRSRASALVGFALAMAISTLLSAPFWMRLFFGPEGRPWVNAATQSHWQALILLFGIVYPLIIGTCIALLVRKGDAGQAKR